MKNKIFNGLWFDHQAEDAAAFYTSIFPQSKVGDITRYGKEGFEIHGRPENSVMTVEFELSGQRFVGINGGPLFAFNPSISFFVVCETMEETDETWNRLVEGGTALMPLQQYDWSEKYGFLTDKFGLSWQIGLGKVSDVGQKITPSFLFVGEQFGRAEEAIHFYTSIFKHASVQGIMKQPAGGSEREGTVMHAQFELEGQQFMIMESGSKEHTFQFNEAISLCIGCETQEEIDHYHNALTDGGTELPCGWVKDKFGVAWQVQAIELDRMLKDKDKEKVARVTKAFLKMKKFDLNKLRDVFAGKVPSPS